MGIIQPRNQRGASQGPWVLVEGGLRCERHGHELLLRAVQEGPDGGLRETQGEEALDKGGPVGRDPRRIAVRHGHHLGIPALDLDRPVRGRVTEDHGDHPGAADIPEEVRGLGCRQEHGDPIVRVHPAAQGPALAGTAVRVPPDPVFMDTPLSMKRTCSGSRRKEGSGCMGGPF